MWLPDWFKKRNEARQVPEKRLKILVLSTPFSDLLLLERIGRQHDWKIRFTRSPPEAFRLVSKSHFELILCDCNQPGYSWREVMDRLAASSPRSRMLLVSPVSDAYLRRDVQQQGGSDVVVRPFREESLGAIQTVLLYGMKISESRPQPVTSQ